MYTANVDSPTLVINAPKTTRKPYNTREAAMMFARGIGRDGDGVASVSIGIRFMSMDDTMDAYPLFAFYSYDTPIAIMSRNGLKVWVANCTYSVTTSSHQSALRWALHDAGFRETSNAIWRPDLCGDRYLRKHGNIEYTEYKRSARDRDEAYWDGIEKVRHQTRIRDYRPRPRKKQETVIWYKVVDRYGLANHGGHYAYSLPVYNEDTDTWTPGAWTMDIEKVELCYSGYHVTNYPPEWMFEDCRIFVAEVEGKGQYDHLSYKAAFRRIRLVREISRSEAMNIRKPRKAVC